MPFPRALILTLCLLAHAATAQPAGLVTRPSTHSIAETSQRFATAVRAAGWVVFTEIDHAAAARAVGLDLAPRSVIIFGNPPGGTPAMREAPTLALDLPMRVLVWTDDVGRAQVTRSSGQDIGTRVFGRHGIAMSAGDLADLDAFLDGLVWRATD